MEAKKIEIGQRVEDVPISKELEHIFEEQEFEEIKKKIIKNIDIEAIGKAFVKFAKATAQIGKVVSEELANAIKRCKEQQQDSQNQAVESDNKQGQ